jgi:shikimate kinase
MHGRDKKGNVYLMGFMGCGKSRIGGILSGILGRPFLDIDSHIAQDAGLEIPEIFAVEGETGFRAREKAWVMRASGMTGCVISLGGGAVLDSENWERIILSGVTVTLSYPVEIIARRLSGKPDRPLLNVPEPERIERIRELMEKREPLYNRADLVLHLNRELTPQHVARMVAAFVREEA